MERRSELYLYFVWDSINGPFRLTRPLIFYSSPFSPTFSLCRCSRDISSILSKFPRAHWRTLLWNTVRRWNETHITDSNLSLQFLITVLRRLPYYSFCWQRLHLEEYPNGQQLLHFLVCWIFIVDASYSWLSRNAHRRYCTSKCSTDIRIGRSDEMEFRSSKSCIRCDSTERRTVTWWRGTQEDEGTVV